MKVLAILQARFSSSRLPGKVLKPILGEAMLFRQIERIRRTKGLDMVVVATSTQGSDDAIEELCHRKDVACYRGSLDDVLDRFYQAANKYKPEHVMRLTGDCPLFDPEIASALIQLHLTEGRDYTSNINPPTFPDGLDIEIMKFSALEKAWLEAELTSEREHVTPYIRNHSDLFSMSNLTNKEDLSSLRWTVDDPADYELVCEIYNGLMLDNPAFNFNDILMFCDKAPELTKLNSATTRNEGYFKSLLKDKRVNHE